MIDANAIKNAMKLSFIILSYNSIRYLEHCITQIHQTLGQTVGSYEVLILDNGSTDGSQEALRRLMANSGGRLRAYFERYNTGTTRSRNYLFARATGDYLCVMDSDVELREGVIEGLLRYLENDPDIGIVVPRIVYKNGAWQKSFDQFPTLADKIRRFFRLKAIELRDGAKLEGLSETIEVDYAISAFWLMRKQVLTCVGGLDEKIFYAPEDVDFCLRVWKAGLKIVYVPTFEIVHDAQEISRGYGLSKAKLNHLKGLVYYFAKHGYLMHRPRYRQDAVARDERSG